MMIFVAEQIKCGIRPFETFCGQMQWKDKEHYNFLNYFLKCLRGTCS